VQGADAVETTAVPGCPPQRAEARQVRAFA
jgi:hypothetical protein